MLVNFYFDFKTLESSRRILHHVVTLSTAIRAAVTKDKFLIEVQDDGRGIDWERVRELARKRNLPHEKQGNLGAALLREGFTTKQMATDVAGRGVGMSAVNYAVKDMGGNIELISELGKDTTRRFEFPKGDQRATASLPLASQRHEG